MELAIVALVVALLLAVGFAARFYLDAQEAGAEAFRATGRLIDVEEERDRAADALEALTVPLGWAYRSNQDGAFEGTEDARLRFYLVAIYTEVQKGLSASDVRMAELRDQAEMQDPPRRLPTRPMIPPYLATAEDVAQVPGMIQTPVALEDAADFAQKWRAETGEPGRRVVSCDAGHLFEEMTVSEEGLAQRGFPCPTCSLPLQVQS